MYRGFKQVPHAVVEHNSGIIYSYKHSLRYHEICLLVNPQTPSMCIYTIHRKSGDAKSHFTSRFDNNLLDRLEYTTLWEVYPSNNK